MIDGLCIPLAATFSGTGDMGAQIGRFFAALVDGRIESIDCAVWGAVLLGITCGVLGTFIVLRRESLLGDAIGHSVLPGVCLGFLVAGERNVPMLLAGALVAGLLAAALMAALRRTTVLKNGECMGAVFTGLYGLGIVLYKLILSQSRSGQSGLDKFLFGQIAGISLTDVAYIGIVTAVALIAVLALWRPLSAWAFDEAFARSVGIPVRWLDVLVTVLLTVAIVISIQAVGVVLVAAMLVIPASTAYLLTDRLHRMALLAAVFGAAAGIVGAFFSMLVDDAPSGAFIVLAMALLFAAAFLLSPRYGLLPRALRLWQRRRRTAAEDLLRTMYLLTEDDPQAGRACRISDIAARRNESAAHIRRLARVALSRQWVRLAGEELSLTEPGLAEARRIVRNHRLWELFLTQEVHLAADHVHADAEYIEHVLPRHVLARLEQMLENPQADPHGRPIPKLS